MQNTVALYNEDVANGEDTQCHKAAEWLEKLEPPLVALDITPGRGVFLPMFTLGGLDTLPTGEVLTRSTGCDSRDCSLPAALPAE